MDLKQCDVMWREDGTVLVRVPSNDPSGRPLPDAVFTFRRGDPQYDYWACRADELGPAPSGVPAS